MSSNSGLQRDLEALSAGEPGALERIMAREYETLKRQARAALRGQTSVGQATTVLHDALIGLLERTDKGAEPLKFEGVGPFFAFMSRTIRNRLVDRIRSRGAAKRGGGHSVVSLDGQDIPSDLRMLDYLDLDAAMEELRSLNERLWQVAENKFFADMTNAEVAQALGLSEKAIERDWTFAKAWLSQRLGGGDATRKGVAGA